MRAERLANAAETLRVARDAQIEAAAERRERQRQQRP